MPERAGIVIDRASDEVIPAPVAREIAAGGPRRVYIRAGVELRKFGFTPRCEGCDAAHRKGQRKP